MSNQLTKPDLSSEPQSLASLLRLPQYSDRFKEVLSNNAPQFISSIIQVGRKLGPDCEPKSIIGSCMIAASLNLPIDPNLGFAWIIAYRVKGVKMASFQMGYKGYVQLALRTGQYSRLNVCEIYEGELQNMDKLSGDLFIDQSKKASDKVVGYASYIRLVSGFEHAEYWSVDTVINHAKRYSQSYKKGSDSPWSTHFDEMAKKTVLSMHIRRWGPMSVDVHKAISADNAVIKDIDAEPEYVDNSDVPVIENKPDLSTPPAEVKKETANETTVNKELKDETPPEGTPVLSMQEALIDVLDNSGIPHDVFANYLNVNQLDTKTFGFDASKFETIKQWPDEACAKIGSDAALLARAVKKYGKK